MAETATRAAQLLGPGDPAPVGLRNADAISDFVIVCDHAGNAVPAALKGLGLGHAELDRHIGIDIGILGVSERLSDLLQAPLVFQRYSRLVAECNRMLSSPESIATLSDGTSVPGNHDLDEESRAARIAAIVTPYHNEIRRRLDERRCTGGTTILISMHSFTPSLLAHPSPRPWHVGVCFGADDRFTQPVLTALDQEAGLVVGRNEPYSVDLTKDYTIPIHAEARGLPYAEFEIRQDLIATPTEQMAWGDRLARVLGQAIERFFGGAHAPG